jgi:hypothetical protein
MKVNESDGWVKLYRQLWENPDANSSNWLSVWLWILCHALHVPKKVRFRGKIIELQPGQLMASRKEIAEMTGIPSGTVKHVLERLTLTGQVTRQESNKGSIITVVKWDRYQSDDQTKTRQRPDGDQTVPATSESSTTSEALRIKEYKNKNTPPTPSQRGRVDDSREKWLFIYPEHLNTTDFKAEWEQWQTHRMKFPRRQRGTTWFEFFQNQLDAILADMDKDAAIASLRFSRGNGYQGIATQSKPRQGSNAAQYGPVQNTLTNNPLLRDIQRKAKRDESL